MPNLKVSKRELRMLGGLLIILVLTVFYYFVYTPQVKALADKEIIVEEKQIELDKLNVRLSQRLIFENQIKAYNKTITELTPKFYGELSQESFMMIINELVKEAELDALSLSFSENSSPLSQYITSIFGTSENVENIQAQILENLDVDESFLADTIYTKDATVSFVGDYKKLSAFLYNIDNYKKHLNINSIKVTSEDGKQLIGNLSISASNLPTLDQDITDFYAGKYFDQPSTREIYDNFFAHYPYYVEMQNKILADKTPSYRPPEVNPKVLNPAAFNDEFPALNEGESNLNENVTLLYDFEKPLDFIPNSPSIIATVARSTDALEGNSSLKLSYAFEDFTLTNQVSLVFKEQSVMNSDFVDQIRLGIKYLTDNNHVLKATLIGSDGNAHEIEFEAAPDDGRWHYTYASVPREVKYPFMIKRIYAESVDVQQVLNVELLVDELSIVNVHQNNLNSEEDIDLE